jgi:hypothetical protein
MSGTSTRTAALAVLVLGVALLLAGCGDRSAATTAPATAVSDRPAPAATSTTAAPVPSYPSCATVWRTGQRLPAGYRACRSGAAVVRDQSRHCSSGQLLVVHHTRWYAVANGPVNHLAGSDPERQLRKVVRACVG